MIQINPEYLNARNAAKYMDISYGQLMVAYPSWERFGVVARKTNGKTTGHLRFKRSELDRMMDQWKVVQA